MKKGLLTILIAFAGGVVVAGNPSKGTGLAKAASVNTLDTVFFDLSQAITDGDNVQFPVYISSDDTVNTLDFAFKFNHANLVYDSIVYLIPYWGTDSHYNPVDSTVRFFCYAQGSYENNTPIVAIRFTTLFKLISSADLKITLSLLNGSACSSKIIDALPTSILNYHATDQVKLYPNPARNILNVEAPEKCIVQLMEITGKVVLQATVNANERMLLSTRDIASGVYMVRVYNDSFLSTGKLVINK